MIKVSSLDEIHGTGIYSKKKYGHIMGAELIHFQVLPDPEYPNEEPCCADEEIYMEFSNGKEMRIYIDQEDGSLCVCTD